ncbi:MAG: M23 family metallopeptidase [Bdellovibrionales bacterium]|nr:M23 family metallopeptidase [Bdellovibrionales bacterium]
MSTPAIPETASAFDDEIQESVPSEDPEYWGTVSVVGDLISGMEGEKARLRPWDPKLCNTVFQRGYLFPEVRSIDYTGPRNIGHGPSLPLRLSWPLDVQTKKDSVMVMRGLSAGPPVHRSSRHDGIDFAARAGAPVRAAYDGEIIHVGWQNPANPGEGYGQFIVLVHRVREVSQVETWITLYGHLSRFQPGLKNQQRVRAGQVIGYVGTTGKSTGPHLHFELRHQCEPFNPGPRFVPGVESASGLDHPSKINFGA